MVELIDTGLAQPRDTAEWLAWRRQGIGASEASAVVGRNPYLNNQALWRYKTGQAEPEDISARRVSSMVMTPKRPSANCSRWITPSLPCSMAGPSTWCATRTIPGCSPRWTAA